ncbi:uncharacterized protein LOC121747977 [Salvia splendens]|uniref:uncharacterized protein LOC121747977 n=1 Tax=Salvia splendens TaxID=180675 RepID=UPI001C276AC0|nr:uncharacterized protein LOC121747977 [Salvia splendens]
MRFKSQTPKPKKGGNSIICKAAKLNHKHLSLSKSQRTTDVERKYYRKRQSLLIYRLFRLIAGRPQAEFRAVKRLRMRSSSSREYNYPTAVPLSQVLVHGA